MPVLAAAVALTALMLLYMMYAGALHGLRHGALRRRVTSHESTIGDLRTENLRLREENARMRSLRSGSPAVAPATTAPDRSGTAPSDQPRATFGERIRAFFGGQRQTSGY